MSERAERCANCRFWHAIDSDAGECRRYPPQLASTDKQQATVEEWTEDGWHMTGAWPWTDDGGWCGEWEAIP